MHYYLASWVWVTDPELGAAWEAPGRQQLAGLVDLRSLPQQARAGGTPEGYGLFAYREPVEIAGAIYLGADGERARNLTAAAAALGVPSLAANTPGEVAWEMRTTHADPTGATRCKPLRGDRTHPVRLKIAGQLVKEEPCTGAHLARTEAVFQHDYTRNRQRVIEGKLPLAVVERWTGYTMQALRGEMSDSIARELVPTEFKDDALLWRDPATTITDDFSAGLGAWTVVAGTWTTPENNRVRGTNTGDFTLPRLLHDTPLSSDEHYCQIDVVAAGHANGTISVCTRVADADNGYLAYQREGAAIRKIVKLVAGTPTELADIGGGFGPPYTIRLTSDASDEHTLAIDDVDIDSASDSDITGNLLVALGAHNTTATADGDDFEAADVAGGGGGGTILPQMLQHGLYAGRAA
jgi:hypothetical protein